MTKIVRKADPLSRREFVFRLDENDTVLMAWVEWVPALPVIVKHCGTTLAALRDELTEEGKDAM